MDEQVLYRNVQRLRGGLVFKADRRVFHSTLGVRVKTKKKRKLPTSSHISTAATDMDVYLRISVLTSALESS